MSKTTVQPAFEVRAALLLVLALAGYLVAFRLTMPPSAVSFDLHTMGPVFPPDPMSGGTRMAWRVFGAAAGPVALLLLLGLHPRVSSRAWLATFAGR